MMCRDGPFLTKRAQRGDFSVRQQRPEGRRYQMVHGRFPGGEYKPVQLPWV